MIEFFKKLFKESNKPNYKLVVRHFDLNTEPVRFIQIFKKDKFGWDLIHQDFDHDWTYWSNVHIVEILSNQHWTPVPEIDLVQINFRYGVYSSHIGSKRKIIFNNFVEKHF